MRSQDRRQDKGCFFSSTQRLIVALSSLIKTAETAETDYDPVSLLPERVISS